MSVGAISGLDSTTSPYHINPLNLVEMANFLPDRAYGGLTTVRGRGEIATIHLPVILPGPCNGMTIFHRSSGPDAYIFACDVGGVGTLWFIFDDGSNVLTQITTPNTLATGQKASFAGAGVWMFFTNGQNTPLKLDESLNATFWGITAPATKPTLTGSTTSPAGGGLSFGQAPYYYCVTFGHTKTGVLDPSRESSQGAIAGPLVLTQAPATGVEQAIVATTAGTLFQFTLELGGSFIDYGPQITINTATKPQMAAIMTRAINQGEPVAYQIGPIQGTITVNAKVDVVDNTKIDLQFIDSNGAALATTGFIGYYIDDFAATGGPYFTPNENTGPSAPTAGATQDTITLTNIPISTDPQVTERNIYRLGGGLGQWRLVTSILDNTTTTYVDTTPDTKLTGQALVISRDPPPPFNHIVAHQQRIFGAGTPNDSSQLWWSNYSEPWGFNALSNFVEVGSNLQGDPIKGLASIGSVLAVLKLREFYSLFGNSDVTWQTGLFKIADIGCQSTRSIASAYGMVSWVSRQGVYMWDGSSAPRNISDGNFQQSNIKEALDSLAIGDMEDTIGFWYGRMYGVSFSTTPFCYMFDPRSQGWYPLTMTMDQVAFDIENDIQVIAVRAGTNQVDQWFKYGTDLGQPVVATGQTRISGDPSNTWTKLTTWILVDAPINQLATFGYQLVCDPGPSETSWPTTPGSLALGDGFPRHRITVEQIETIDVQLSFSVTTTQVDTTLYKISVYGLLNREFSPEDQADS